jgi:hypothetical protein
MLPNLTASPEFLFYTEFLTQMPVFHVGDNLGDTVLISG